MSMRCTICEHQAEQVMEQLVLGKHRARYFRCGNCGLLFTEEPHWLAEAYDSAIARADTGLLQRNIQVARTLTPALFVLFPGEARFLDYAGGYGILTRLMRDAGFDFYWNDKYCDNLFARGFEATGDRKEYAAVTAIEVFEHVHRPKELLEELCSYMPDPVIIFTTQTYQGNVPDASWWYYAFGGGQHISFYEPRTLAHLGSIFGMRFYSRRGFHILSKRPVGGLSLSLALGRPSRWVGRIAARRQASRTFADHHALARNP